MTLEVWLNNWQDGVEQYFLIIASNLCMLSHTHITTDNWDFSTLYFITNFFLLNTIWLYESVFIYLLFSYLVNICIFSSFRLLWIKVLFARVSFGTWTCFHSSELKALNWNYWVMCFLGGAGGNLPVSAGDIRDVSSMIAGLGRSPGGGMAIHSHILAWGIAWTEEPGSLQSIRLQRVGHDWSNLVCTC